MNKEQAEKEKPSTFSNWYKRPTFKIKTKPTKVLFASSNGNFRINLEDSENKLATLELTPKDTHDLFNVLQHFLNDKKP